MAKKARATAFVITEQQAKQPAFSVLTNYRFDGRLLAEEKILLSEIILLSARVGYCYASNKTLGDLFGYSERTTQRYIEELEKFGYIKREFVKVNGVENRRIFPTKKVLEQQPQPQETVEVEMLETIKPVFVETFKREPKKSESKKVNSLVKEFGEEIVKEAIVRSHNASNNVIMYIIRVCNTVKAEKDRQNKYKQMVIDRLKEEGEDITIDESTIEGLPAGISNINPNYYFDWISEFLNDSKEDVVPVVKEENNNVNNSVKIDGKEYSIVEIKGSFAKILIDGCPMVVGSNDLIVMKILDMTSDKRKVG